MEKINLGQQMLKWNSCTSFERKTRVFCSMLSTVPSTGGLKKPYSSLVVKLITKQYQPENRVYAQKPRLKMPLKNSLSGTREHSEGTVQEWKMKGGKG
jgi:hypothetical protein